MGFDHFPAHPSLPYLCECYCWGFEVAPAEGRKMRYANDRLVASLNWSNLTALIVCRYLCNPPRSACTCLLRLPQQTCCTLRKPCSLQSPPAQLAVCYWFAWSVGGSCPTRARTRRSGYRSLVCSRPSFGRSRRSRRLFSGRQSSPLLRWIGRRKLQIPAGRPDRSWRHRWQFGRIWSVLRSSPLWTKITRQTHRSKPHVKSRFRTEWNFVNQSLASKG